MTNARVTGLRSIELGVPDLERSSAFYQNVWGVEEVVDVEQGASIRTGMVDVGKHLRPSYRGGRVVLFVEAEGAALIGSWRARKLE